IVLLIIVTPPFRANALPSSVAPVLKVMDSNAITVPLKTEVVPKVAELPTCQKILDASAPPLRITLRPDVVVRSPLAVVSLAASGTEPAGKVPPTVYIVPVTSVKPKPVMNDPAAGLNPISPVTADVGTFEIFDPARIAKLDAPASGTVAITMV